ncbi:hypothetical protein MSAN_00537200 [Mycena sanguinolenta]|uniref:CsbD-like domain-containing protein n=1 Tax=Mycena sanguinolenta TaxID=230812 RepID=A0A8H6Z9H4_9AGAR|nr:hypothetical protein MSAN_00537200 [Mycena sanguinolenta]
MHRPSITSTKLLNLFPEPVVVHPLPTIPPKPWNGFLVPSGRTPTLPSPTRELDPSDLQSQTRPDLPERSNSATGRTAFTGERPLNTQPHPEGGVAIDGGHEDMPMGKASATDKLIGKAQKIIGKVANKPEMHEKGELRESGGKAAAMGNARAPHD